MASISIAQAALGTRITVPTVDGTEEVEIKPGTQPDTEIKLRGKGVPHLRRAGQRGDLHVMVDVVVPTKLSKKAKELLTAYAEETKRAGRARRRPAREARALVDRGRRLKEAAASGAWLELAVEADVEAVEAVSEILGRAAPGGTSRRAGVRARRRGSRRARSTRAGRRSCVPISRRATGPPPNGPPPRWPRRSVISRRSGCARSASCSTRIVEEADWADAWKAYFPVMRVGRRLVIRPTWRRHRRAPDDVVLALDPGMAFGTGLHPTTRLCLAGVEALADRGMLAGARVLDVGCGSGILAIAALKLGRRQRAAARHRSDRDRGDHRQRAPERAGPPGPRTRGQPAQRRGAVRCRPRQPDRRAARPTRRRPRGRAAAGWRPARVGDLRRPGG